METFYQSVDQTNLSRMPYKKTKKLISVDINAPFSFYNDIFKYIIIIIV